MTKFSTRRTMMVDTQVRPSDVTKFPIIEAMLTVERENYVADNLREAAYADSNLSLNAERVVLEPRSFAKMLDALDIQNDELVLDLGCGLGYSSAVIARMAEAVVAVEADADLAAEAQTILSSNGADNVAVIEAPLAEGAAKFGPYDVITLQGAVEVIPQAIIDQLKDGGRIAAIFMEGALGVVRVGHKVNGTVHWRMSFNATAPILVGFEENRAFAL
ncbi:protein-L-isoaspartate O-methyltransferase family protein [Cochlodiniinecator piscidefendens]|uniref:protein-L-isoaspartate O-methyltransferase family protein n=1 Tax=Cochlodiniinecator piscidefendens TaxID=2715756 RepID=UPI00140A29CD|nr:protein-L-isoaspartate O-methyltransferase [Cochlodiniinecator piscidefendens]